MPSEHLIPGVDNSIQSPVIFIPVIEFHLRASYDLRAPQQKAPFPGGIERGQGRGKGGIKVR